MILAITWLTLIWGAPASTMSYPHCGPITLQWIICRKWQQLPCVPPTSPHCDHDNHAHHHHKPSTLLMGFNRKRDPIVIHQVSPLSLTIFDVVMFHVFTKLNWKLNKSLQENGDLYLIYLENSVTVRLFICSNFLFKKPENWFYFAWFFEGFLQNV